MQTVELISRITLGLSLFYFGLNGIFKLRPLPSVKTSMAQFIEALERTLIIFPVVKIVEILCGVLLLSNILINLVVVLMAPILFFIFLSHLKFNFPQGLGISVYLLTPYFLIVWGRFESIWTFLIS